MEQTQTRFSEQTSNQTLSLLARVPLFAGLEPQELQELGGIAEEIDAPAGTVLTHEGRHEGYFFVIVSGTVRIDRGGKTINTIGDGDFLGEIALLDGGPRTATATTTGPCRLVALTNERFDELLARSAPVRAAVLEEVGRRLRKMDEESVV